MRWKKLVSWLQFGGLLCGLMSGSAFANTESSSWMLNVDGTGVESATSLDTVNVTGSGYVQAAPVISDLTTYTFQEDGAYHLISSDGSALGDTDITVVYSVGGTGSFLDSSALSFSSGVISLYADENFDFGTEAGNYGADNGTLIGTFTVTSGSLDNSTGLVSLTAETTGDALASGYFFNEDGTDMSFSSLVTLDLGVYNMTVTPTDLMVSEIVCGLAGSTGAGCDGTSYSNTMWSFTVSDGGYASLSSIPAVPEPEMLSMLALGLGVVGFAARRGAKGHQG